MKYPKINLNGQQNRAKKWTVKNNFMNHLLRFIEFYFNAWTFPCTAIVTFVFT